MRNRWDDPAGLLEDLEALLQGEMSEAEFRVKYQTNGGSPLLELIWGNLEHYLSDSDLRAKDQAYRQMQDAELRRLIGLIRTGAPDEELRRITFLTRTDR